MNPLILFSLNQDGHCWLSFVAPLQFPSLAVDLVETDDLSLFLVKNQNNFHN